jgi:transketolase
MHYHREQLVKDITIRALQSRIDVLHMVRKNQSGHIGGAFSIAEVLASLYFHHMHIDPKRPDWIDRDRLLFSKGHACAMLYSMLAHRGFFDPAILTTFRSFNTILQGHPDPAKTPGVEIPAGPLGHGIAVGTGMALSLRMRDAKPSSQTAPSSRASPARVYVIVGDGELNAGVIWEGIMAAAKFRLGNLTVILDYNGIQQTGATVDVMPTEPIADKWQAFGWHVQEIHGHNVAEVLDALDRADEVHARPSVIIARTVKGKGVGFMEYDHRWHGASPNDQQLAQAVAELEKEVAAWQK